MRTMMLFLRGFFLWCAARRTHLVLLILGLFLAVSTPACSSTLPREPPVNTCDTSGGKSGAPYCLPPPGFFCERNPLQPATPRSGRGHKAYLGQFELFPSKQGLGINQPACPQNATRLLQDQEWKIAHRIAKDFGHRVGFVLATCERITEELARQPVNALAGWNDIDPDTLEAEFMRCAKDLDKLEAPPLYDDSWLAGAAWRGFNTGYGEGADEVWHRVMMIEFAIAIVESAIMAGLPLLEVAVTRGIRISLIGLRRMPIFLPGAVGGLGAGVFLKTAPRAVAKAVATGSARALGRNMEIAGMKRLAGEFAHHIVAHGADKAKKALEILQKFDIKVDDAVNGVFLPGHSKSPNPLGKAVHSKVHTDAYYRAVERLLQRAKTKGDAIQTLRFIAGQLEKGIMP
ncbi:MAG: AHH domain-containing protein [Polyangiaceae bacterium]|nr:AHH domain-containing protein [Polyangiaceae bacterium]